MSHNVVRLADTLSSGGRQDRELARSLIGLERFRQLGIARLEAQAEIEAARMHALGYVGQQAMQALAMMSQAEQQLAQLVPLAASRLQAAGDTTTLAIVMDLGDLHWRLR